jgi:hypothetical protein
MTHNYRALAHVPETCTNGGGLRQSEEKYLCSEECRRMPAPAFRRNRQRGVTQAEIARVIRAAREADPGATIEFDARTQRIPIKVSPPASAPAAAVSTETPKANAWDEVYGDAAVAKRTP